MLDGGRRYLLALLILALSALLMLGGVHIYAILRVERGLDRMQGDPEIRRLTFLPRGGTDQRRFRFRLTMENPTDEMAEIRLENVQVTAGEIPLGYATWVEGPERTVEPGETAEFIGQFLISEGFYKELESQDTFQLHIEGEMEVSISILWVKETERHPLNVGQQVLLD